MLICFVFLIYIIFFSYSFFSSVIKTTTTTTKLQNRPNIVYIHKNSTNCFSSGWMAQTTQNITAANNYYQHWINTQKKTATKNTIVFVCLCVCLPVYSILPMHDFGENRKVKQRVWLLGCRATELHPFVGRIAQNAVAVQSICSFFHNFASAPCSSSIFVCHVSDWS